MRSTLSFVPRPYKIYLDMESCVLCNEAPREIGRRCKPCHRAIKNSRERARYSEQVRERKRKNYYANHARNKALKRAAYRSLPADVRQQKSKNCRQNHKTKCKTIPGYRRAFNAWQRAYRNLRLPKWVKLEDFIEIYSEAERGVDLVVDHVLPLRGELVSGLHVPENLQIMTRTENLEKGNRYEP